MTIETTPLRSRRTLLTAGAAALAGLAATALGRPTPARAANGDPLIMGVPNFSYNAAKEEWFETGLSGGLLVEAAGATLIAVTGYGAGPIGAGGYFVSEHYGVIGAVWQGTPPPPDSSGVYGQNGPGRGVFGEATSGVGVDALATTGIGMRARSSTGPAIDASSVDGVGVRARSSSAAAVDASSVYSEGVYAFSSSTNGVHGVANSTGAGVLGQSDTGPGVQGFGQNGIGVSGDSDTNIGVRATSRESAAVVGIAGSGSPTTPGATGVFGFGDTGVHGIAGNPGGVALRGEANTDATALQTRGPVDFRLASGSAWLRWRSDMQVITPGVPLTADSRILCSLESQQVGLSVHRITKDLGSTPHTFTVYLSGSLVSGRKSRIHWFVIG